MTPSQRLFRKLNREFDMWASANPVLYKEFCALVQGLDHSEAYRVWRRMQAGESLPEFSENVQVIERPTEIWNFIKEDEWSDVQTVQPDSPQCSDTALLDNCQDYCHDQHSFKPLAIATLDDHVYTHFPSRKDCPVCQTAKRHKWKSTRGGATRSCDEDERIQPDEVLIAVDLTGPTKDPTPDNHRYLMVARRTDNQQIAAAPLDTKLPRDVIYAVHKIRKVFGLLHSKVIFHSDGEGSLFSKAMNQYLMRDAEFPCRIVKGIKGRSNTNSIAEKAIQGVLNGVRSVLYQSGAPPDLFWDDAAQYYAITYNVLHKNTDEVMQLQWNQTDLKPFGVKGNVLLPPREQKHKDRYNTVSVPCAYLGPDVDTAGGVRIAYWSYHRKKLVKRTVLDRDCRWELSPLTFAWERSTTNLQSTTSCLLPNTIKEESTTLLELADELGWSREELLESWSLDTDNESDGSYEGHNVEDPEWEFAQPCRDVPDNLEYLFNAATVTKPKLSASMERALTELVLLADIPDYDGRVDFILQHMEQYPSSWLGDGRPVGSKVTRVIPPRSPEFICEEALNAIKKELKQIIEFNVVDLSEPVQWEHVRTRYREASQEVPELVRSHLIVGVKNAELERFLQKYKARLVADGHNVRTVYGALAEEPELFATNTSLAELRFLVAHALSFADGYAAQADIDGAYLNADLGGAPKFIQLPKQMQEMIDSGEIWSDHPDLELFQAARVNKTKPRGGPGIGRHIGTVYRLRRALYGLQRSGFDWADCLKDALAQLGWIAIPERQHLYKRGFTLMAVYVDDLALGGPKAEVDFALNELQQIFKISKIGPLSNFLGLEFEFAGSFPIRKARISQKGYAELIVERYLSSPGAPEKSTLRKVTTPMVHQSDVTTQEDDESEGSLMSSCRRHVGSLLYLMRGSRPDLVFPIGIIARSVSKWTKSNDRQLMRIIQYLMHTTNACLEYVIDAREWLNGFVSYDPRDVPSDPKAAYPNRNIQEGQSKLVDPNWDPAAKIVLYTDSDFAGCRESQKSTSGVMLTIQGANTYALIDWVSKRQDFVALSSTEAELVALARGVEKQGIPLGDLVEDLYEIPPPTLHSYIDNNAAKHIVFGSASKVKTLRRVQRVHIQWLRDVIKDHVLRRVDTKLNVADLGTKALPSDTFNRLVQGIGLILSPESQPANKRSEFIRAEPTEQPREIAKAARSRIKAFLNQLQLYDYLYGLGLNTLR